MTKKAISKEPSILTTNTYFWYPGRSSHQRRANEASIREGVKAFLEGLGFTIEGDRTIQGSLTVGKDLIEVSFYYKESCNNVYKSLHVKKNGKRSNITTLRKLY